MTNAIKFFFLCIGTFGHIALAQDFPSPEYNLNDVVDEIFPLQDQELNYEELYENLLQRVANPLDLNTATAEEFRSLFVLKESQIKELLAYREKNPFLSVYELQVLPGFDLATIYRLIPFVWVGASPYKGPLWARIREEKNNYFLVRLERTLEQKGGFIDPDSAQRYLGSPNKWYARFRTSRANDFSLGFTLEKDAGEAFRWARRQAGFDFYSAHVQLNNLGKVKNLIIGDYHAQFGQGLVLGGGFGVGKGAETITTLRKSTLGFLPYTSVNEFGFLRGVALSIELSRHLRANLLVSHVARDGSLTQDSTEASLSSLLLSGFHRTPREIFNRKQVGETNLATAFEFRGNALQAGLLIHQTQFSTPLRPNPSLYNHFFYSGHQNSNASFFFNYNLSNFTFFGEAAQTFRHGKAAILGLLGSISNELDMSLVVRTYARNFYSFYGNALSENSSAQNESGVYWGWKYVPSKKVTASGYVDLFRFPWLRYRSYAPSDGSEWLVKLHYRPSKATSAYLQLREETKARNVDSEQVTYRVQPGTKRNLWLNVDYTAGPFDFKSRLQHSWYQHAGITTTGFALIQDISFSYRKILLTTRYTLFDTDNFENRQYIFERDVWLAYSIPGYQGTGIRTYIVAQFQLSQKIDLWLRWARTAYQNQTSIGSGGEQIDGNSKNDLKLQARIRL